MNWFSTVLDRLKNEWFHFISEEISRLEFFVPNPDLVGLFPVPFDITVLPADNPRSLRLGWSIYEEIGGVVISNRLFEKSIYPLLRIIKT